MDVALGGAWSLAEAFGGSACCSLRGGPAGTTSHQTSECPTGWVVRDAVGLRRVDGPPCLLEHGLVPAPPRQVVPTEQEYPIEIPFGSTVWTLVVTHAIAITNR